jgi:diacylglycerol kinase (CTP)
MTESTPLTTTYYTGFKKRSDVHLARKVWHMSGVFALFLVWTLFSQEVAVLIFAVLWLMFVPGDILRLQNKNVNQVLTRLFKPIMRENELHRLAGTSYLLTGTILLALIFEVHVVSLSLLFLSFADPIASFVGIKYGKDKLFNNKSLQGFMAAFVVCFLITCIFLYVVNVEKYLLVLSLCAGVIGAVSELIPVWKLDDNLTMPLFSSFGLTLLFTFFGVFRIAAF